MYHPSSGPREQIDFRTHRLYKDFITSHTAPTTNPEDGVLSYGDWDLRTPLRGIWRGSGRIFGLPPVDRFQAYTTRTDARSPELMGRHLELMGGGACLGTLSRTPDWNFRWTDPDTRRGEPLGQALVGDFIDQLTMMEEDSPGGLIEVTLGGAVRVGG